MFYRAPLRHPGKSQVSRKGRDMKRGRTRTQAAEKQSFICVFFFFVRRSSLPSIPHLKSTHIRKQAFREKMTNSLLLWNRSPQKEFLGSLQLRFLFPFINKMKHPNLKAFQLDDPVPCSPLTLRHSKVSIVNQMSYHGITTITKSAMLHWLRVERNPLLFQGKNSVFPSA